MNAHTRDQCGKECFDKETCTGYEFRLTGLQQCLLWLHGACSNGTSPGYVGNWGSPTYVRDVQPPQCDGFEFSSGVDIQDLAPSSDVPAALGPNAEETACCDECSKHHTCAGFTMYNSYCYFKSSLYLAKPKANWAQLLQLHSSTLTAPTPAPADPVAATTAVTAPTGVSLALRHK